MKRVNQFARSPKQMKLFRRHGIRKMKEKKESFYKLKMSLEDKIKLMNKIFEGTYLVSLMSLEDKIKLMNKMFEGTYLVPNLVSDYPHSPSLPPWTYP